MNIIQHFTDTKHGLLSVGSVLLEPKSRVCLYSPKDVTTNPINFNVLINL